MRAAKLSASIAAAVALATLAGCMSGPMDGRGGGAVAARPTGVEGSWTFAQDGSVSTFGGGRFVTTAGDTGQKLSEGSYTFLDSRTISMNGMSAIRQSPVSFNCALASPVQLNCTSSSGNQFVLTRRAVS